MPYTLGVDDSFASRTPGGAIGNGWVSLDPIWGVQSNGSAVPVLGTPSGANARDTPLNGLVRPAGEASISGKVLVFCDVSSPRAGCVGRYDATGGGAGTGSASRPAAATATCTASTPR